MSRYIREVKIDKPNDFVNFMINDFITKHGFKLVEFKGQMVYRAGGGWFEMPKFMLWGYQNGVFHMEAWTRTMWLPGVYGKENDLSGFYGALPKESYKNDVEQFLNLLFQPLPGVQQQMPQPGQPGQQMPQTVYVQGVDTSRYANMALGFGIIGLLLSWSFYGIFFQVLGIIYGVKGKSSSKKGRAIAGMVCAIIGIVILVFFVIVGFAGGLLSVLQ